MKYPDKLRIRRFVVALFLFPVFASMTALTWIAHRHGAIVLRWNDFSSWCLVAFLVFVWGMLLLIIFLEKIASAANYELRQETSIGDDVRYLFLQALGTVISITVVLFFVIMISLIAHWGKESFFVRNDYRNSFSILMLYYSALFGISILYPEDPKKPVE